MPTPTYTLIASNTLSSSQASVTFSSIPQTYTDLVLRISARTDLAQIYESIYVSFNGDDLNNSKTILTSNGATVSSNRLSDQIKLPYGGAGNSSTASTFGSAELYIPNYAGSTTKPASGFGVGETNATTAYMGIAASLWNSTTAITSLVIDKQGTNFLSGSSFFLYGIKNS